MNVVRWGLVGCGDISRKRVAPALRDDPGCELVAVSRARAELAQEFANEFGARKWYADWEALVRDSEIDAVYIATPVYLHARQTIAAAEAGKHVLCEKPMALHRTECDEMLAACRANNVKLGVAYYRHFYPVVERIKQYIEAGKIGTPVVAQMNVFGWFDPAPDHPRRWLIERAQSGGGPMMDVGGHRIEVLLHVLGPITRTTSMLANVVFAREVEDTATALFQFERGTLGVLAITHAAAEPQDTFDLFGSAGSMHVRSLNEGVVEIRTAQGTRQENYPCAPNTHAPLIQDFVDAILNGREPAVDGALGARVASIQDEINTGFRALPERMR